MQINKKIEKLTHSKKPPYIAHHLLTKINNLNLSKKKEIIKTWSRASMISPIMIGHTISVHNGRKHVPIYISNYIIGHKLGEFVATRTFHAHKNVEKKLKRR